MKIYLWEKVLTDYTDGAMFAYADSVEEAKELILQHYDSEFQPLKKRDLIDFESYRNQVKSDLEKHYTIIEGKFGFQIFGGG